MFATKQNTYYKKLLLLRSHLLMKRIRFLRFLKKSSLATLLIGVARLFQIPLLAGERNQGKEISLKEFAAQGTKKHIVVVLPNLFWNFRWQRPQQLFSRCAQEGYSVLFVSIKTREIRTDPKDIYEAGDFLELKQNAPRVLDVKLPSAYTRFILNDSLSSSDINTMSLALSAVIYELSELWKRGVPEVTYVVEHPNWEPLVTQMKKQIPGKVILDLMDNHRGFDQVSQSATRRELKLLKTADATVVSSLFLKQYAQKYTEKPTIIRNGADYKHFSVADANGALEALIDAPIIGYFGALNEWFDMELVAQLATRHPEWNFVLIGSLSPCDFSSVERLKNVFFIGEVAYEQLPGYLAYFDVCFIPFKINPLTLATNPVKFYEYISMGKQVVSTPLPELEPYKDNCRIACTADEFSKELQTLLSLKASGRYHVIEKKNKKLAKKNTWEQRWNKLKQLF